MPTSGSQSGCLTGCQPMLLCARGGYAVVVDVISLCLLKVD